MKHYLLKALSALFIGFATAGMVACSSSDDDSGSSSGGGSVADQSPIAGVYAIDSYTLSLYNNYTFAAVDNSTNSTYTGIYTYDAPNLVLSSVAKTRAFSLEDGKSYSFTVTKGDGKNITLKNNETGETYALTYVAEAPSEDIQLTPDQEKAHIEATARELEKFFDANDLREFTELAKELKDVNSDAIYNMPNTFVIESFTGSEFVEYPYYVYRYDYYDRLFVAAMLKGHYEASYGGQWVKTDSLADFRMTYTDKNSNVWEFAVAQSGSSIGKIKFDSERRYDGGYYYGGYGESANADTIIGIVYDRLFEIPSHMTATMTFNGVEKIKTDVNITKFENATDGENNLSLFGQANGTADVTINTAARAFAIHTDFNYANGANSTVNTTMKCGDKTLLTVAANATATAETSQNLQSLNNANAKVTILNRLTVNMFISDGRAIADAYNKAESRDNRYDESFVKNCADIINNNMNAYITNGPASTTVQGIMKASIKSREGYKYNYNYTERIPAYRYELIPILTFSDNSSYAFEDYFTESFFKNVIDYARQLGEDLENALKK